MLARNASGFMYLNYINTLTSIKIPYRLSPNFLQTDAIGNFLYTKAATGARSCWRVIDLQYPLIFSTLL